jgi:hypothetical protein
MDEQAMAAVAAKVSALRTSLCMTSPIPPNAKA